MYSRNLGSNWPSSGAAMACSTRGCALIGPGPISSRSGGFRSSNNSAMRMVLQPVARDVEPARDPHFFWFDVTNESLQGSQPARAPHQTAMQADRHHASAFSVQDIETIFQVGKKVIAAIEAL